MKSHDINRWVFEIPLSDIEKDTDDDKTLSNVCLCCGKKLGKTHYEVHLLTNGNLVSTDQDFAADEDQGFFPIGGDCRRKLPNNFVF